MNNDNQQSEDAKWTVSNSDAGVPPPLPVPPRPNNSEVPVTPQQSEAPASSVYGPAYIAPQAPVTTPQPPPHKPTPRIYGHQTRKSPIGMRLLVAIFGLVLIGGVGYLSTTLFNTGQEKINSTLEVAWGNPIYEGDGGDIVEIVEPLKEYVCLEGYTQSGSGASATCTKVTTDTKSPAVYNCPSGYTKSGSGEATKCSKIVGGTKVAVAASSAYTCASGYTKSGSGASTKCTKTESTHLIKTYSCESNYLKTGEGDALRCVKADSIPGTVRGSCPSGYTKSGSGVSTTCKQTINASSSISRSCPSGYSLSGSSCKRTISATGKPYYYCTSGYSVSGSNCVKTVNGSCSSGYVKSGSGSATKCTKTVATIVKDTGYTTQYSCPTGYTKSGIGSSTKCTKTGSVISPSCGGGDSKTTLELYLIRCSRPASQGSTYSCPSGYSPSGSGSSMKCNHTVSASSSTSYSCPSGYTRSGTTCSRTTTATLSCDSGFAKSETGSATKCLKISMDTKAPIVSTTCPNSFSKSGDKCTKTLTIAGTVAHVCESGYALSGNQCTKIVGGQLETTQPNKTYACPADYDKSGEGANMKCTKVVTDTKKIQSEYVCQDGWFKREVGKSVDCARTASGKKPSTEQKQ